MYSYVYVCSCVCTHIEVIHRHIHVHIYTYIYVHTYRGQRTIPQLSFFRQDLSPNPWTSLVDLASEPQGDPPVPFLPSQHGVANMPPRFVFLRFILCVHFFLTCMMYVYYMHVSFLLRPEEGVRYQELELQMVMSPIRLSAGHWTQVLCKNSQRDCRASSLISHFCSFPRTPGIQSFKASALPTDPPPQFCLFLMYGGSQTAQLASVIAEHNLELLFILVDRPLAGMPGVSHRSNLFLFLNIK